MMARVLLQPLAEQQGLDISKLARKADLNYRTVHELWNNPDRDVSLRTLEKLAAALSVPVRELLEEDKK